ncbi:MAG: hypothetical protein AB1608_07185 [Thermoproteota archaeon]
MKNIETLKNKKTKIVLSILAIAVVGMFVQNHFADTNTNQELNNLNDAAVQTLPMPPPNLLKQVGVKSSSFDEAKSKTGLAEAFTPSYVPDGLVIESTRHIVDPSGNRMLILYLPAGKTTTEDTSIRQVIEDGMVIEIVREKPDNNFNWNGYVSQAVTENPSIRSSTTINNHVVLLIKENPEINYPNMAKIVFGNTRIEVASDQFDPTVLAKVLESMVR